jgi:hypothetical protein
MSSAKPVLARYMRRQYFLPNEHGSWIWWLGPLAIGTAAAGRPSREFLILFLAALCAFLIRQPAAMIVKVRSGRRPGRDLPPAVAWFLVYSLFLAASLAYLINAGYARILVLALPGVLVFAWHLWLISRRTERGRRGIELVGAGALALSAPAAYWVAGGEEVWLPWILWIVTWLQAAASIVNVYDRLAHREWEAIPSLGDRLRFSRRNLTYHGFNLFLALILSASGSLPWASVPAFLLMLIDAGQNALRPAISIKPTRIGMRQLLMSTLFTLIMSAGFM